MSIFEDVKNQREKEEAARIEFIKINLSKEEASTSEGIKALLAINGGGIVAMLGFMQALISKPAELSLFKYYGANALIMFVGGVLFAALTPALRVIFIKRVIRYQTEDIRNPSVWEWAAHCAWGVSLCLFVSGALCASLGIQQAFLAR